VLYVHDSTWRLRRGFAYATVPKKRKIAPAGCCTYMILRGDYGEASRMLPESSKYSLYYYYDVRCTRPPPIHPPLLRGMGACYVQRTPPAPDRPLAACVRGGRSGRTAYKMLRMNKYTYIDTSTYANRVKRPKAARDGFSKLYSHF